MRTKLTTEQRFWVKVDKNGPLWSEHSCWVWLACKQWQGYGFFTVAGKNVMAHRYAYELLVGGIPNGLQLDHLCRNPSCVNPTHLEPVTCRTNVVVRGTGITAQNQIKTTCPQAHPYDLFNTWVDKRGKRYCRTCSADRERDKYRSSHPQARQYNTRKGAVSRIKNRDAS